MNIFLNIGRQYQEGLFIKHSDEDAFKWVYKAAELGNSDAQCELGNYYAHGIGVAQSTIDAEEWYQKAIKQGNPKAKQALISLNNNKRKGCLMSFTIPITVSIAFLVYKILS